MFLDQQKVILPNGKFNLNVRAANDWATQISMLNR